MGIQSMSFLFFTGYRCIWVAFLPPIFKSECPLAYDPMSKRGRILKLDGRLRELFDRVWTLPATGEDCNDQLKIQV
jgi:hypothetical protein